MNHAVTGDLKNDRKGVKSAYLPLDIPVPPFEVSAPQVYGSRHNTDLVLSMLPFPRFDNLGKTSPQKIEL